MLMAHRFTFISLLCTDCIPSSAPKTDRPSLHRSYVNEKERAGSRLIGGLGRALELSLCEANPRCALVQLLSLMPGSSLTDTVAVTAYLP
jgi:hypothetical protein